MDACTSNMGHCLWMGIVDEDKAASVVEHLHYRVIDVSTIKELARRWYARAYFQAPAKLGGHRALGDIKDSIDELRYYREAVFVPAPGPDSATALQISKRISAEPSAVDQLIQDHSGRQGLAGGILPAQAEAGPAQREPSE